MIDNTSPKKFSRGNTTRSVTVEKTGMAQNYSDGRQRVTVIPLSVKRRHTRKLIVRADVEVSQFASTGEADHSMLVTLGRAFYWHKLLDDGQFRTVAELAKALRLEIGWVAEVLRMTLLAPDIIQAILDGKQPRYLNLHVIRGRAEEISRDWSLQRKQLGFPDR